jgi:hypothetical protein
MDAPECKLPGLWMFANPSISENTNDTVQLLSRRLIESSLQKGYDFHKVYVVQEFEVVYESLYFDITFVM